MEPVSVASPSALLLLRTKARRDRPDLELLAAADRAEMMSEVLARESCLRWTQELRSELASGRQAVLQVRSEVAQQRRELRALQSEKEAAAARDEQGWASGLQDLVAWADEAQLAEARAEADVAQEARRHRAEVLAMSLELQERREECMALASQTASQQAAIEEEARRHRAEIKELCLELQERREECVALVAQTTIQQVAIEAHGPALETLREDAEAEREDCMALAVDLAAQTRTQSTDIESLKSTMQQAASEIQDLRWSLEDAHEEVFEEKALAEALEARVRTSEAEAAEERRAAGAAELRLADSAVKIWASEEAADSAEAKLADWEARFRAYEAQATAEQADEGALLWQKLQAEEAASGGAAGSCPRERSTFTFRQDSDRSSERELSPQDLARHIFLEALGSGRLDRSLDELAPRPLRDLALTGTVAQRIDEAPRGEEEDVAISSTPEQLAVSPLRTESEDTDFAIGALSPLPEAMASPRQAAGFGIVSPTSLPSPSDEFF